MPITIKKVDKKISNKKSNIKKTTSIKKTKEPTKSNDEKVSVKNIDIKDIIYLDNNGTTTPCPDAIKLMNDWLIHQANPSGDSDTSNASKNMLEKSKTIIQKICNADNYEVIFTSGASESNCLIIKSIVAGWKSIIVEKPHIISSQVEHKSIISCLRLLESKKEIELTLVEPDRYGLIHPKLIEENIKKNTILISIMFANNEIGNINPIHSIGEIANKHNIPFHSDCVQIFGKNPPNLPKYNISCASMTFHKLHGPQGVGLAIISKDLIEGYNLTGEIAGTQQGGLRGGTENCCAIASSIAALQWNNQNRDKKNIKLLAMRNSIIDCFNNNFDLLDFYNYYATTQEIMEEENPDIKQTQGIIILGPPKDKITKYLPNTLLISLVDHKNIFCNTMFKKILHTYGVIVSIGSACNTKDVKGSHVLEAIYCPNIVVRGTIRISLSDMTTQSEVNKFCNIFTKILKKVFTDGFPKSLKK